MDRLPAVVRYALPAYLLLLLLLAFLGATNQNLYYRQAGLIERRQAIDAELGAARRAAATVIGPLAVAEWATANQFIPVPEADDAVLIAAESVELAQLPLPNLEIRTRWR